MEKLMGAVGGRKMIITAFLGALLSLMLDNHVLASQDYKELMLVLMGGFFGANIWENKSKVEPGAAKPFDPKKC